MKLRLKIPTFDEWLVFCALAIFLSINILQSSFYAIYMPGIVLTLFKYVSLALLIFAEVVNSKIDRTYIIRLLSFSLVFTLLFLSVGGFSNFMLSYVFIYFLRNYPFERLVKLILPVTIFWLLFIVISSKLGIIKDYVEYGSRIRHYLGFRYSLFAPTYYLNIVGMLIYYYRDRISYILVLILTSFNFLFFLQTNSRLTFISTMVLILVALLLKWVPSLLNMRWLTLLLIPSYGYASFISFYFINLMKKSDPLARALNSFLGGRLYFSVKSLAMYGYGLIGKKISWSGNGLNVDGVRNMTSSYLYVDNLYLQILQSYGLIFFILLIILLTYRMVYLFLKKEYLLLIILSIFAFHGMIDDLTMNLSYNSFLLLIFSSKISDDTSKLDVITINKRRERFE